MSNSPTNSSCHRARYIKMIYARSRSIQILLHVRRCISDGSGCRAHYEHKLEAARTNKKVPIVSYLSTKFEYGNVRFTSPDPCTQSGCKSTHHGFATGFQSFLELLHRMEVPLRSADVLPGVHEHEDIVSAWRMVARAR